MCMQMPGCVCVCVGKPRRLDRQKIFLPPKNSVRCEWNYSEQTFHAIRTSRRFRYFEYNKIAYTYEKYFSTFSGQQQQEMGGKKEQNGENK